MGDCHKDLPIPDSLHHYADPACNDEAQSVAIAAAIHRVHYPTLGCPALLGPGQALEVLLSLPEGTEPAAVALALVDRHDDNEPRPLAVQQTEQLSLGPESASGKRRRLWRLTCATEGMPFRLYDLQVSQDSGVETQHNAVRLYEQITGEEQVILCGDTQYNGSNEVCTERFIDRVNALDDIAWIALIGDVCDNGVHSKANMAGLVIGASPRPVVPYYSEEYRRMRQVLCRLNKPILLLPGNHDGMTAYHDYKEGKPSKAYLGRDETNELAYDGLHHYRRTFGPLYYSFDWHETRYLCTNTFELDRHMRLGYHAVVSNWGGWMRPEQHAWLTSRLQTAEDDGLKHKVLFMHHDPRGGSEGKSLGYYHHFRPFTYDSLSTIALGYLRYVAWVLFTRARWQQEWMYQADQEDGLQKHPVRRLLGDILEQEVWGVFMGHDNHNWIESYQPGDDIFTARVKRLNYAEASPGEEPALDGDLIRGAAELLRDEDFEGLGELLGAVTDDQDKERLIEQAIALLEARGAFKPTHKYAPKEVKKWRLETSAPIRFIHVDDVGAYKHGKESHFKDYGYVVARLRQGRPITLQAFEMSSGEAGDLVDLLEGE